MSTPLSSADERVRHWDAVYEACGADGVSWFQRVPETSLELLDALGVPPRTAVVDVGGGASRLVDCLLERGFEDVTVLDLSARALELARARIGADDRVSWLREDVLAWRPARRFGLWHDRAVLHFLVEPASRDAYLAALRAALEPGGAVVLGTFAEDAPDRCSGLPVARYGAAGLLDVLGDGFTVVETSREVHRTPRGTPQPFTWVAARARR